MSATTTTEYALRDLYRTITNARDYGEVWWLLDGEHPERDMIIKAFEGYGVLFETLRPGMFVAFIILLSSLFDKGSDCITLKSIPGLAADPAFAALWSNGRRLYTYRSKAIAHRDVRNESVDFAAATGFTYNKIRGILNDTCSLYDRYAQTHGLATLQSRKPASEEDLLRIIRKLTE